MFSLFRGSYLCVSLILQPLNNVDVKILAGDEVIQVNNQVVVSDTVYRLCVCMYSGLLHYTVYVCLYELSIISALTFLDSYLHVGIMICVASSGGLDQGKSCEKTAGESQCSDSGPKEGTGVSATQSLSPAAVHHAGRRFIKV